MHCHLHLPLMAKRWRSLIKPCRSLAFSFILSRFSRSMVCDCCKTGWIWLQFIFQKNEQFNYLWQMASRTLILVLFLVLCLLNLWAEYSYFRLLIFMTKPLLITSLALWFFMETKNSKTLFRKLILSALAFSVLGDTLLMFVENDPAKQHFFLMGLGSFLVAHLFYLAAFVKYPSDQPGLVFRQKWWITIFAVFLAFFNWFLLPGVPKEMQIPVLVYSIAIMLMLLSCLNLSGKIPSEAFGLLFLGALLFMISDSIIALNKFKSAEFPIPLARIFIMAFYLLGQFLIVRGSAKVNNLIG